MTRTETFIREHEPFVRWMLEWIDQLPEVRLSSLMDEDNPNSIGIVSVDVIEGFCHVGPLASPRVVQIIDPIKQLLKRAWELGVRDIALTQDTHFEDAVEFAQFAPHCIRGTIETEAVADLKGLPFFEQLRVFPKNSIASGLAPDFRDWVETRSAVRTWITVGDCTDLCTHQLAMFLRLEANQNQRRGMRIVLPVNCVDTYDMSVATAHELGIVPHDAEFLHLVFLYHMMLNGVEVVRKIV